MAEGSGLELFSAFGKVLLEDDGVTDKLKSITKEGENTNSGLSNAFDKIKSTALKLGAALVGGIGLKEVFDEATESQEAVAQMNAVLASTHGAAGMSAGALTELAESQSKVTEYSKNQTMAAENMLLTFTNIGKDVFPDVTKTALDMATAMGMDSKSAAEQLGKALNDPATGMSKLTKEGVTFSAAQEKQIKDMEAAGNVAGAQKVILQELQKEFAGSAEAAGKTFGGQLVILKNNLMDVGAGIMEKLLPPIQTLVSSINNHMPQIQNVITSAINTITPFIKPMIKDVQTIAIDLFPSLGRSAQGLGTSLAGGLKEALNYIKEALDWMAQHGATIKIAVSGIVGAFLTFKTVNGVIGIINNVKTSINNVKSVVGGIAGGISSFIGFIQKLGVAEKAQTAVQWLMNAAMNANPVGIIITVIAGLVAAIIILFNTCKPFHNWVLNAFSVIKATAQNVANTVIGFFERIGSFLKQWGPLILTVLAPFLGLPLLIIQHWNQISGFFNKVGDGIIHGFDAAIDFLKNLPGNMQKWGEDMINGLINGIKNTVGKVKDAASDVANAIHSVLHFSVPDEGPLSDADQYGGDLVDLISSGIQNKIGKLKDTATNLASTVSNSFKEANMNIVGNRTGVGNNLNTDILPYATSMKQGDSYSYHFEKGSITIQTNNPNEFLSFLRGLGNQFTLA